MYRFFLLFFVIIFLGFFLSFSAFFPVPFASAQTSSSADLQALVRQLQEQIKTLQAQVKTLEQELGRSSESTPRASATETPVSSVTLQLPVLNIPETAVEIPELRRNLGVGSRGEYVKKLQKYLTQDKEIYPEGLVTGFFGPKTEEAVKRWQKKQGIEAVGIVGPESRDSLRESVTAINFIAAAILPGEKVTICHFPPGNPDNGQTIEIDTSALSAHLVHGDTIGACVSTPPNPKPTPTPFPPAAAVPTALLPPPATQEGNNVGTARFSYSLGGDKYSQLVTFYYDASALPRVRSFRFYYQKPTDPSFNVVATFNNPASLPSRCTSGATVGTLISGEWKLDYTCGWKTAKHGVNPYWRIRLNNEYPASYFTPGEYKFYLTAVDAPGLESAPSSIFKQYVLEPLRIISPTTNQSPVASPPVIKWTIAKGWPSTLSSLLYNISIGDGKYGVYSKPLWNVDLSLCESSFVYDGPPLDPSKTYTIGISSQHYVYHVTPTQVSHPTVDYVSMLEKREKFKVSGAVSTTTAIASAVSTPCPSSVSAAAPIIFARPATTTSATVPPPAATTTPLATSTALAIPAIPAHPIGQTSTTTIPATPAIPAQSAVPASVVPQPLPSSSLNIIGLSGLLPLRPYRIAMSGFDYIVTTVDLSRNTGRLIKVTPAGDISTIASFDKRIFGVAVSGSDFIVSDGNSNILRVTAAGMVSTIASGVTGNNFDSDIAVSGSDFVVTDYDGGRLLRVTPSGVISVIASGLWHANSVTVDGTDFIVAANTRTSTGTGNATLYRVTPEGRISVIVEFSGFGSFSVTKAGPYYYANYGYDLVRIAADRTRSVVASIPPEGQVLDLTSNGSEIIATDYSNARLLKITVPNGTTVAPSPAPTPAVPPAPAPTPTATTTTATSSDTAPPTIDLKAGTSSSGPWQDGTLTVAYDDTNGSKFYLYWTSSNATTCLAGDRWAVSGSKPLNGTHAFIGGRVLSLLTYSLSCSNASGTSTDTVYIDVITSPTTSTTTVIDPSAICKDTDGGKDYFVKGSVYSSDISRPYYTDYCDGSILHEFSCNPLTTSITGITQSFYTCPNGCLNGACIQSSTTTSAISSELNLATILKSLSSVLQKLQKALR